MDFKPKMLVSPEDEKLVARLKWVEGDDGYIRQKSNRYLSLHRFIAGKAPEGFEIDHINKVRNDNRRENLRWATKSANQRNKNREPFDWLNAKHKNTYAQVRWYDEEIRKRRYFSVTKLGLM